VIFEEKGKKAIKVTIISLLIVIILSVLTWQYLKNGVNGQFVKYCESLNETLYKDLNKGSIVLIKKRFFNLINGVNILIKKQYKLFFISIIDQKKETDMVFEILAKIKIFKIRLGNAPDITNKEIKKTIDDILNDLELKLLYRQEFANNKSIDKYIEKLRFFKKIKKTESIPKTESKVIQPKKIKTLEKKPEREKIINQPKRKSNTTEKLKSKEIVKQKKSVTVLPVKQNKKINPPEKSDDLQKETLTIPFENLKDFIGEKVRIIYKIGRVQKGTLLAVERSFLNIHVFLKGGSMKMKISFNIIERVEKVIEKNSFYLEDFRGN